MTYKRVIGLETLYASVVNALDLTQMMKTMNVCQKFWLRTSTLV